MAGDELARSGENDRFGAQPLGVAELAVIQVIFGDVRQGQCQFDKEVAVAEGGGCVVEPVPGRWQVTLGKVAACQQAAASGGAVIPVVALAYIQIDFGKLARNRQAPRAQKKVTP